MSQALPVQHNDHPLPIARYRFSARAIDAVQLPLYAGSLLRGSLARHCAIWPA